MDTSKAEKIAQAKKKLKQYQARNKKEKDEESQEVTPSQTPVPPPQQEVDQQTLSSLESLNQLSARISSLVSHDTDGTSPAAAETLVKELETRNQELAATVHTEKLKNDELSISVRELNSQVATLKIEVEKLKVENSTKVTMEVGPLQEQLNSHLQTIGVLVGEKAELQAYLKEYQNAVQEKRGENEELQTRLRASRFRVSELEREVKTLKDMKPENVDLARHLHEIESLRGQNEEYMEQINELKQKVALKSTEISELRTQLDSKASELSMAQLKIEQLTTGDTLEADSRLESLTQQNLAKDLQIAELRKMIEQLGSDRDQSSAQYQSYVMQLNRELAKLGDKNLELTEENDKLAKREASLVRHVGDLEVQIQRQMKIETKVVEPADQNAEISALKKRIDELQADLETAKKNLETKSKEYVETKRDLDDKTDQFTAMELTIERLQLDKPDTGNLIAELESQKVTASRAVSQNTDLKIQLEEMQKAFVQISNDKLELTEKLQSEQHLCREMRTVYEEMETELTATKERLLLKDTEMIRLAHETTDLNKQILQKDQELDQLRHYASSGDSNSYLQAELQQAKSEIEHLNSQIASTVTRIETPEESTDELSTIEEGRYGADAEEMVKEIEMLKIEKEELLRVINDFHTKKVETPTLTPIKVVVNEKVNDAEISVLPPMEALERLQHKFTRTMEVVGALTEEKERLEHLVVQLQFETETIGEYITLYQNQRRQLKEKDIERDRELLQLAMERETLKQKLLELNDLIEQLLTEKRRLSTVVTPPTTPEPVTNGNNSPPVIPDASVPVKKPVANKLDTKEAARKILALLSDIQNVNHPPVGVDHCPCCQGKLAIV